MVEKEMIPIYSIIKYIDYMTKKLYDKENYFLCEKEILFFLWGTEKPQASCLIHSSV